MIQLPRRSVTRFFIPLIDVLTLLFCIFLVMPLVQSGEGGGGDAGRAELIRQLEDELERLRKGGDPRGLQAELERLRQQVGKSVKDRVALRVLEIDPKTGRLLYYNPEPVEVRSEADAKALIENDRRERAAGRRELYYLILYPRDRNSPYPTIGQIKQYERWFAGVALGFDIPGEAPPKGGA